VVGKIDEMERCSRKGMYDMQILYEKLNHRITNPPELHQGDGQKVLIYQKEANRIAILTLQYPNIETGGSLFGYWTHSGSPIISFAGGPGHDSRHNKWSFYHSESYLLSLGTELYDKHGLQHVGEWHSHHQLDSNKPSDGDVRTIISEMRQRDWSRFLLLITTIKDQNADLVLENYFLFSGNDVTPRPLGILLLPGSSPFRKTEHAMKEEAITPKHQLTWQPGPYTPDQ
jgi:hypothetical protein